MEKNSDVIRLSGGEIYLWADDGRAIHIKAVTPHGDPVELSASEATQLAQHLLQLAQKMD